MDDPLRQLLLRGPATPLRWNTGLEVRLGRNGSVTVRAPAGEVTASDGLLTVLRSFARPATLAEVLSVLVTRDEGERQDLAETVRLLVKLQALVPEGPDSGALPVGFGGASVHLRMLHDRTRTMAFMRALEACLEPGDVVLDLGTGTGILAAHAARLGASRVFAVESGAAADAASAFVRSNGLENVEVLRGWSQHLDLPVKADVVVSETLGNHPLEEGLMESLRDARRRLARPGAKLIPAAVEVVAVPVRLPFEEARRRLFRAAAPEWREAYGFDFAALADWQEGGSGDLGPVSAEVAAAWPSPTGPLTLTRLDPESPPRLAGEVEVEGPADAVVLAFRAWLAPGVTLSTVPGEAAGDNHWSVQVHRLEGSGRRLRWRADPAGTRFRLEK